MRKLNKWPMVQLHLLLVFLLFLQITEASASALQLELSGDLLTVSAEDVPLRDILAEFSAAGISVKIDPQVRATITADFVERPLEQAIASLVKPASYSLVWKKSDGDKTEFTVAEIQIFQAGRQGNVQPLKKQGRRIVSNGEGLYYVAGEILINLPRATDLTAVEKIVAKYGASIVFSETLPGLATIIFPENVDVFAMAEEIKKLLGVDLAEPNYAYPRQMPTRYEGAVLPPSPVKSQKNVAPGSPTVAILDSGVSRGAGLDTVIAASLNAMDTSALIDDTLGHGTQMALIASGLIDPYGVGESDGSPVPVIPIKTFTDEGFATSVSILESIHFAIENNAGVMSLSWGTELNSAFLERAFSDAEERGLVIVASAGNEPNGKKVYPAAYPSVLAVGALQPDGKRWTQSNYGDFVTLYAPGFANMPVGYQGEPGVYGGTSISAALVANSAAVYLRDHTKASRAELDAYLLRKYGGN